MPSDSEILAKAQQQTAEALAALAERVGVDQQRALDSNSRALSDLGQAVTTNTQELGKVSRDLSGLPSLLAGVVGSARGGGGLLGGVLGSGFGLASLGLRIAGLFRNGSSEEPPRATSYQAPPSLALEVANTENILAGYPVADRGQAGEVRVASQTRALTVQPQVTVNVSAMDSRSFLDHSAEIAQAVRDAMLHMHPVNDVINEL